MVSYFTFIGKPTMLTMLSLYLLTSLIACFNMPSGKYAQSCQANAVDSILAAPRVSPKPFLVNARSMTLNIHVKATGKGGVIALPLGVISESVVVKIGEKTLTSGNDYVYLPEVGKLRIFDNQNLRQGESLSISYKRLERPASKHISKL